MKGFFDIHTHILPGVDDGAGDISEAMRMVRMAWENGTRALVLTPHWRSGSPQNDISQKREVFDRLYQQVSAEYPELELYLGSEVRYGASVPEMLEAGEIQTLNGSRYVLLEFRTGSPRSQILSGISRCIYSGFTPIIAHAERYDAFYKDASLTEEVLNLGALIQVNAQSILGRQGLRTFFFCGRMLRNKQVHFVASDCHHSDSRTPLLHKCWKKVTKRYGEDYSNRVFYENARRIIQNQEL